MKSSGSSELYPKICKALIISRMRATADCAGPDQNRVLAVPQGEFVFEVGERDALLLQQDQQVVE